jgi:phenylpropionate dioxygenase-like ring-hydroxylating dioxygenase large terminal subunit
VVTQAENELLTRIEGDAPMGRLMREHHWVPFAQSAHISVGDAPLPVRLFGENFVAFRGEDGSIGFLDELCPHRRASLVLGRVEGNGLRCIYHGWKIDTSGCVVECPTQTVRAEQFAASVRVARFPVREAGGIAWVWLGGGEAPEFPYLPFADEDLYRYWVTARVPCNWLQGLEGSVDSVHVGMLHQTWISAAAKMSEHSNLNFALAGPPEYEVQRTPYGLQAAALRPTSTGERYVRITEHLAPFVTITPTGDNTPRTGAVFLITPVDDTHHLLFFGTVGPEAYSARTHVETFTQDPAYQPEPLDFSGLTGDRSNRWGQQRDLMGEGHWSGFGRTLLEEDAAVQASMGPIVDRSKENLSSSDVAVVQLRRMLLDALASDVPPGSVRTPGGVRLPNASEMLLGDGADWRDRVAVSG